MKICYVLTCNDEGLYADLTYLSVLSVAISNPAATVLLVADEETCAWLRSVRHPLCIAPLSIVPRKTPYGRTQAGSRDLKTNLRGIVDGDFIFMDADTIVLADMQSLLAVQESFAAVADRSYKWPYPHLADWVRIQYAELGWKVPVKNYLNSGVMWVRDSDQTRELFDRWHAKWDEGRNKGICIDQPSLNSVLAEYDYPIRELSWRYNAMIDASPYYLWGAKVLHYYQSQQANGGMMGFFWDLARRSRTDAAMVSEQLRTVISHPMNLLRLFAGRRFITQLPWAGLGRPMLWIRRYVAAKGNLERG